MWPTSISTFVVAKTFEHRTLQSSTAVVVANANASWEAGALTMQGNDPGSAFIGNVTAYNNPDTGRVLFYNQEDRGKPEDPAVASHAFAFKFTGYNGAMPWQITVPFAIGKRGGRDFIWTPEFNPDTRGSVDNGRFITDNLNRDENMVIGVIEIGDYRAIDGDYGTPFGCNRPGKVCFQKFNGNSWTQIGRTNGPGDDGNLVSFTVLTVRTKFTLDPTTGKIVNVYEDIPIALINGVNFGRNLGLQTPNYGNNIGTQSMFLLPLL